MELGGNLSPLFFNKQAQGVESNKLNPLQDVALAYCFLSPWHNN